MTEFPFVYKKFFPLGSPPNTKGWPLCVRGNVEKIYSGIHTKNQVNIKSYLSNKKLVRFLKIKTGL